MLGKLTDRAGRAWGGRGARVRACACSRYAARLVSRFLGAEIGPRGGRSELGFVDFEAGWGPNIERFESKKASQSRLGSMQLAELEAKRLGKAFGTENWLITTRDRGGQGPRKGGRGDG